MGCWLGGGLRSKVHIIKLQEKNLTITILPDISNNLQMLYSILIFPGLRKSTVPLYENRFQSSKIV